MNLKRQHGLAAAVVSGLAGAAMGQLTPVWEDRYNGPDSSVDLAWASVLDRQGNLVVAASSPANFESQAFITLKYGPGGRQWERRLDGSGTITFDRAVTVATDAEDNVIVGGLIDDEDTEFDGMVAKYTPEGTLVWQRQLNFFGLDDQVTRVLVGPGGEVYVVGTTHNGVFGHDTAMYAVALNPSTGEVTWTDIFEHVPSEPFQMNAPDVVMDAKIDRDGNLVVVGFTGIAPTFDSGLRTTVIKYVEGQRQWVFRDTEDVHHFNGTTHLDVDPANNLFVVFARGGQSSQWDTGLMKLSGASGAMAWKRSFAGLFGDSQRPVKTLFDYERDRIVIMTQVFEDGNFPVDEDVLLVAYDTAGVQRWSRRWTGPGVTSDTCQGIVADGQGNAVVLISAGNGPSFSYTDIDWVVQQYRISDGTPGWSFRYGNVGSTPRSYRGKDLKLDASRRALLVVGESAPDPLSADAPSFDITVVRMDLPRVMHCSADFNNDGDTATDQDIEAFFACIGGNCCALCGSPDFNNDGNAGTDQDIEAFFRVVGGHGC
ncbi:MAG TPA: hypothetical protein VD997_16865 [Phycisphaerales bacterium]|nr:hypothetical protein [Phycisphaerales bacterium]